jgi:hypothetical protein
MLKHDGAHTWKDCPENWCNKNRAIFNDTPTTSNSASTQNRSNRGKVKSTEYVTSHQNNSPMVKFDNVESDDESAISSIASQGELMNIVSMTPTKQSLHPITILTLLDKNQQRITCTTLLDQCCTNNDIISWKLPKY